MDMLQSNSISNAINFTPPYQFYIDVNIQPRFHVGTISAQSLQGFSIIYFITSIYVQYSNTTQNIYQKGKDSHVNILFNPKKKVSDITKQMPFTIDPYNGQIFTAKGFRKLQIQKAAAFFINVLAIDSKLRHRKQLYKIKVEDSRYNKRFRRQALIDISSSGVFLTNPQLVASSIVLGNRVEIKGCNISKNSLGLLNVRSVSLIKNGTEFLLNNTNIIGDYIQVGTFVIEQLTASDSGIYQCFAENGTHSTLSPSLTLPVFPLPTSLEVRNFTKPTSGIVAGFIHVALGCTFESDANLSAYAYWIFNSSRLDTIKASIDLTGSNTWQFTSIFTPFVGFYQCAFEIFGVNVLSPISDFLIPTVPSFATPPSIDGVYNRIGDTLTILGCQLLLLVPNSDYLEAHLLKDGQIRNPLDLTIVGDDFLLASTIILNSQLTDSGLYQCRMFDKKIMAVPVISEGTYISPKEIEPSIIGATSSFIADENSDYNFTCFFNTSISNVTSYKWFDNDIPIHESPDNVFAFVVTRKFSTNFICQVTVVENVKINSPAVSFTVHYLDQPVVSSPGVNFITIKNGIFFQLLCSVESNFFNDYNLIANQIQIVYTIDKNLEYRLYEENGLFSGCPATLNFTSSSFSLTWNNQDVATSILIGQLSNTSFQSNYTCNILHSYTGFESFKWFTNTTLLNDLTSAILFAASTHTTNTTCDPYVTSAPSVVNPSQVVFPDSGFTLDQDMVFKFYQGRNVILYCEVVSFPTSVSYQWFKDDVNMGIITANISFNAQISNIASYLCQVTSGNFIKNSTNRMIQVVYFSQINFTANNINSNMVTITEGSTLNFSCNAFIQNGFGNESIIYNILKEDGSILSNSFILSVSRNDAGVYVCMASVNNLFGFLNISSVITLQVQYLPSNIILSPNLMVVYLKFPDKINVSCSAEDLGNPVSTIQWTANGTVLTTFLDPVTNTTLLSIEVIDRSPKRNYTCEVKNNVGMIDKSFEVIFQVPSDPPKNLTSYSVTAGTISLFWEQPMFTGNSPITNYTIFYQALNSSVEVQPTKRYISNTYVDLPNLFPETFYEIHVYANNELFFVTELVSSSPSLARIYATTNSASISVVGKSNPDENGFLDLTCQPTDNNLNISMYQWFKNGVLLSNKTQNIKLFVDNRDSNIVIKCQVTVFHLPFNSSQRFFQFSYFHAINFTANSVGEKLSIQEGAPLTLSCIASIQNGYGNETILYEISQGTTLWSKVSDINFAVSRSDAGIVTCKASVNNSLGAIDISSTLEIDVQYAPGNILLSLNETVIYLKIGNNISVSCFVSERGNPISIVQWLKNNLTVPAVHDSKTGHLVLTVSVNGKQSSGNYTCHSQNSVGFIEKQFQIIALVQPDDSAMINVTSVTPSKISISWTKPLFDGNSPITNYSVFYQPHNSSFSKISYLVITTDLQLSLTNLIPASIYEICVYANNEFFFTATIPKTSSPTACVFQETSEVLDINIIGDNYAIANRFINVTCQPTDTDLNISKYQWFKYGNQLPDEGADVSIFVESYDGVFYIQCQVLIFEKNFSSKIKFVEVLWIDQPIVGDASENFIFISNGDVFSYECTSNATNKETGEEVYLNFVDRGILFNYTADLKFVITINTVNVSCIVDVPIETVVSSFEHNIGCFMKASNKKVISSGWNNNSLVKKQWSNAVRYASGFQNLQDVCKEKGINRSPVNSLQVLWLDDAPTKDSEKYFFGYENAKINISCEMYSANPPVSSYRWFENNTLLPVTSKVIEVTISRSKKLYWCEASNGNITVNSTVRRIEALYLGNPVFLGNNNDTEVSVKRSKQLTLVCIVPKDSYNALFPLTYNITCEAGVNATNSPFVIESVKSNLEGECVCVAITTHKNLTLFSTAVLQVVVNFAAGTPLLNPGEKIVKRKLDDLYTVECTVKSIGKPASSLKWLQQPDGIVLKETLLSNDEKSLVLSTQVTEKIVNFTCQVSNYIKTKTKSFQLIPVLQPGSPQNLRAVGAFAKLLDFIWEKPLTDGNSPITNYTVNLLSNDGNRQVIVNSLQYTFESLTPDTTYTVNIQANNEFYFGLNPVASLTVVTRKPDPTFITHPTVVNRVITQGDDVIIQGCQFEAFYALNNSHVFYLKNNNEKLQTAIRMEKGVSYIMNLAIDSTSVKDDDVYQCIYIETIMQGEVLSDPVQLNVQENLGITMKSSITVRIVNENPLLEDNEIKALLEKQIKEILDNSFNTTNLRFTEFSFVMENNLKKVSFILTYVHIEREDLLLQICINNYEMITKEKFQGINIFNVTVDSNICCGREIDGREDYYGVYEYIPTLVNNYVTLSCVYNNENQFNRSCYLGNNGMALWETIEYTTCNTQSQVTKELETLAKGSQSICNSTNATGCAPVSKVSKTLENVTSSNNFSSTKDVQFIQETIVNIVENSKNLSLNQTLEVVEDIIKSVNNLVTNTDEKVIENAQRIDSSSNTIIKNLNTQSQTVREKLLTNNATEKVEVKTKTLSFTAVITPKKNIKAVVRRETFNQTDDSFAVDIDDADNKTEAEYPIQVDIPAEAFPNDDGNDVVSCTFHRESALFRTKDQLLRSIGKESTESSTVQSYILAVVVGNQKVENLTTPVTFVFEKINNLESSGQTSINFWDTEQPAGIPDVFGVWSNRGVITDAITSKKFVTGTSDHLTNFALLLNVGQTANNPLELQIVTWIGCGISIACLLVSVVTFLMFRSLLKKMPHKILLSLCVSLLILLLIFLIGAERTSSKIGCQIIAGLLHYFLLSTFLWMFIEACNLYRSFVKVFGTGSNMRFFVKASILAWGLPLVIVVISASSSPDSYSGGSNVCIVSGLPFYIAVLAPVCLIILFNFVVLIVVMKVLTESRKQRGKSQEDNNTFATVRIAFSCNLLLGITWVFAALAIGEATMFFQWCFCVANSLQGCFIFLFYVFRSPEVRKSWLIFLGKAVAGDYSVSNGSQNRSKTRSTFAPRTSSNTSKV